MKIDPIHWGSRLPHPHARAIGIEGPWLCGSGGRHVVDHPQAVPARPASRLPSQVYPPHPEHAGSFARSGGVITRALLGIGSYRVYQTGRFS